MTCTRLPFDVSSAFYEQLSGVLALGAIRHTTPMSCCQFANLVRFVVAFGLVAAAVVFALGQCRTLNVSAPSQSVLSRDASSLLWILSQTESALQWRQRELQVCLAPPPAGHLFGARVRGRGLSRALLCLSEGGA